MVTASRIFTYQASRSTAIAAATPALLQWIQPAAAVTPLCTRSYSSRLSQDSRRSKRGYQLQCSSLFLQTTGFSGGLPAAAPVAHSSRRLKRAADGYVREITTCTAAASSKPEKRPSLGDLEAGLSSEAVGIDEAAIDAIPAESMPAGANRTDGPQSGISPDPELDPEAGDPQPDASRPPSGPSGPDQAYEAGEAIAGKPRTSGPEVDDSSREQQPEVQGPPGAVNPDRIPFWGS
jgi:hypothetical protein